MNNQVVVERSKDIRARAAAYCRKVPMIDSGKSCFEVLQMFQTDSSFPCIIVGDAGRPIALIMRGSFSHHLTGRFSADLFYGRPALDFAEHSPLICEVSIPVSTLLDAALNREDHQFYDCLILTDQGLAEGVLTVQDLMALSRDMQREAEEARMAVISESRSKVIDIETSIEAASEASRRSLKESERMTTLASAGSRELEMVKDSFVRVAAMTHSQAKQVVRLTESAEDISQLAFSIRTLADQCGMLAMNASIEAAHAGEHGRGFAVVAAEVKKLAMQTKQLSGEIDHSLEIIGGLVNETADNAKRTTEEMKDSQSRVEKAENTFGFLVETAHQARTLGQEVVVSAERATVTAGSVSHELSRLAISVNV